MAALKFAIDFDSAFTNVYKTGSGLVLSEPTAIAVNQNNKNEINFMNLRSGARKKYDLPLEKGLTFEKGFAIM